MEALVGGYERWCQEYEDKNSSRRIIKQMNNQAEIFFIKSPKIRNMKTRTQADGGYE